MFPGMSAGIGQLSCFAFRGLVSPFRGSDTSGLATGARFVSCISCRGGEGRSVTVTNRSLDMDIRTQTPSAYDHRNSEPPMDDQTPPKSRRDTPAGMSQPLTVDDLRRAADSWRDLRDPALMAKACTANRHRDTDHRPSPDHLRRTVGRISRAGIASGSACRA